MRGSSGLLVAVLVFCGAVSVARAGSPPENRLRFEIGVLCQQLLNAALVLAYHLGVPPGRLASWNERGGFLRRPSTRSSSG